MRTTTKITIAAEQFPDRVYVSGTGRSGRGHFVNATSVERGPLLTNARSVVEAKRLFGQAIENLLDDWSDPQILAIGGFTGVCYMHAIGLERIPFAYKIVRPDGKTGGDISGFDSMAQAVASCKNHLTQYVTDYSDDQDVVTSWEFLNPDQRHGFERYTAWQRAAAVGSKAGVVDVHSFACNHEDEYLPGVRALIELHTKTKETSQ